ncbi:MAG: S-layer homology domain-containing protein, partial [Clostridiales Family XIII bacterium]|nr:S-layer homology domain-containing protein [Clostridiales Family XIII bacterium]
MIKIVNGILRAALCAAFALVGLTAAACPAFAATSSLNVPADAKEFTVEIRVNEDAPFASAEFGLDIDGGADVKLLKYEKSAELGASVSEMPDEGGVRYANGMYLFGFASVLNNYSGSMNVGTLTFSYEGDAPSTLTLSRMKIARLAEDGETVEGDLREGEHFVINVGRADGTTADPDNTGNSGSPGGGAGGGAVTGTSLTVDIDEGATPLAGFLIDRIAYINGYPDGSVRPDGGVTRAEVASMLFRLLSYA